MLADFRVAMLVVCHNYVAQLGGGDARLAVELARQIALPVLLVLAYVLDAERVAVVHQQWLAPLAQHKLQLPVVPLLAGRHWGDFKVQGEGKGLNKMT